MPASVAIPLVGEYNASGFDVLIGHNNSHYYYSMQLSHANFVNFSLTPGNRCGHDKNKIKVSPFYRTSTLRNRSPHVIEESGKRLAFIASQLRTRISQDFIDRGKDKPSGMLSWYLSLYEDRRFLRLLYDIRDDRPSRRRRSESLEAALFITLGTLISRCNLYKMAYGYFDQRNRFDYFDYARIVKHSGLTLSRVKRAMKVLQDSGLVKVTPIYKTLNDGAKVTDYTVIELSEEVFFMLGLKNEFLDDRETSSIKFHAKQSRLDKKQAKREMFRKPNFSTSKKKAKPEVAIQSLAQRLSINRPKVDKVQPNPIAAPSLKLYGTLVAKGYTPQQAIELIKKTYPPPN